MTGLVIRLGIVCFLGLGIVACATLATPTPIPTPSVMPWEQGHPQRGDQIGATLIAATPSPAYETEGEIAPTLTPRPFNWAADRHTYTLATPQS